MTNGDLHLLGTLYKANIKQMFPSNPVGGGNIPAFSAGQLLEIRDADSHEAYKIKWREINIGAQKLLISDRNILQNISWDDLNTQSLISGKEILIDGISYKLRVLSGGNDYRTVNDNYSGGSPLTNEWDRIIVNAGNYEGLPVPTSTDLTNNASNQNGAHNGFWNWFGIHSLVQERYISVNSYRIGRGFNAARYWGYTTSSNRHPAWGWRPVLEVLSTPPEMSVKVNGAHRQIESSHVKINGVWREVEEVHAKVNGIWRKV